MICSHCREIVFDLARDIAHPEKDVALQHVNECDACRRHLQQQRALTAGLRALSVGAADDVPSETLEQRLMAAIAAAPAETAPTALRSGTGNWMKLAAAILLAASVILLWQWRARKPGTPASTQARSGAGIVAPADRTRTANKIEPIPAGASTGGGNPAAGDPRVSSAPRRTVRRNAQPKIVPAAQFVMLPAASMLPPFERGEIVRVRVQVASLASLGFTVQPDAADTTPITADLLVGQDGHPRAIRLVTLEPGESRSRR